jgi:hypothetical protein
VTRKKDTKTRFLFTRFYFEQEVGALLNKENPIHLVLDIRVLLDRVRPRNGQFSWMQQTPSLVQSDLTLLTLPHLQISLGNVKEGKIKRLEMT